MMVTPDSSFKTKMSEQGTQCIEGYTSVGSTHYDVFIELFVLSHVTIF